MKSFFSSIGWLALVAAFGFILIETKVVPTSTPAELTFREKVALATKDLTPQERVEVTKEMYEDRRSQ